MSQKWQDTFPRLYELYQRSDTKCPNNYFNVMASPQISDLAAQHYARWDKVLAQLDSGSYELLLSKAARFVCVPKIVGARSPDWSQMFDILNEARGYTFLLDRGYTSVRLIPETSRVTPDVCADGPSGRVILETKTIHRSDLDLQWFGRAQSGIHFLPKGFRNKLKATACEARDQILCYLAGEKAQGICYFVIQLDAGVHHVKSNYDRLDRFLRAMSSDEFQVAYEAGPFNP